MASMSFLLLPLFALLARADEDIPTARADEDMGMPQMMEETVEYMDMNNEVLMGMMIYEDMPMSDGDGQMMRPGLMVFDGPWGDGGGASAREYARDFAKKGMVVFLPDYFVGMHDENDPDQVGAATALYGPFLADPPLAQDVAMRAYNTFKEMPMVDNENMAAIGFCFGGAMVLNAARAGAAFKVAMSFHGEYPMRGPPDTEGTWMTDYFVEMVGVNDPLIPQAARDSWVSELTNHTMDNMMSYDMVLYGNTYHGFSIRYSEAFMGVLAAFTGSQVVQEEDGGNGVLGVVHYDAVRQQETFDRIDDLFEAHGLIGAPSTTCRQASAYYADQGCCGMPEKMIPMMGMARMD